MYVGESRKQRHPVRPPAGMKPYLKMARLPTGALGAVRRSIEADEEFRTKLAAAAVPDIVGEIGMLWLQRPDGWQELIAQLVAAAESEAGAAAEAEAAAAELRKEQRRREAAEQTAARARAELVERNERIASISSELERTRGDMAELGRTVAELRADLVEARTEARHANDRATAATEKLERLRLERDDARQKMGTALNVRDEALADRAASTAEVAQLSALAIRAQDLADELAAVSTPSTSSEERAARRRALSLPGGVVGDSAAATEFLLRSGATVLVDGYNVAKLQWPDLDLGEQRRAMLDVAENAARRFGADLTVVFDGAEVVGASSDQRRLVRVVYSPAGVTADDVIRSEVARLPADRAVVVVTNDAAIVRDVRQQGANTVSSNRFLVCAVR